MMDQESPEQGRLAALLEVPSTAPTRSKWMIRAGDADAERDLADKLNLHPIVARLLVNRGVRAPKDAETFLHPSKYQMHSPFLFRDMEKALARIRRAINRKEKIFVFGDRDADGVSGAAILILTLRALGATVDAHIPAGAEGYGVHPDIMARALRDGFTLGITVDTGICEIDRVAEANAGGMDVLIADHHTHKTAGDGSPLLPAAHAILHPGIPGEPYPFKHLSGAGVAFKLAMALFAARSPFANRTLVVLDVETTGLDRVKDEVIEIAAVKYRNGIRLDEYVCLTAPSAPVSEEITRITGITDSELAEKGIDRKIALRGLIKFLSEPDVLVLAYNVEFDRDFLAAEFKRNLGVEWAYPTEDIMAVASGALPGLASRKLTSVAAELGVPLTGAHRALADTVAAAEVFHRLLDRQNVEQSVFYERLVPLAALAAVADMMPLVDENRAIVAEGLRVMRDAPPLGIKALLESVELSAPTGRDIAFLLGPLLNAPGRLGDATPALDLLIATSKSEARELSGSIVRMNTERKQLVKDNFKRLMDLVPGQNDLERDRIICVSAEGVPQGVTGIVASRIKNETGRPVLIVLIEDGKGTGSSRSIESLNMVEAVGECADLLEKFGGHHQAVGMTIRPENIVGFFEKIKRVVAGRLRDMPEPQIEADAELKFEDLTLATLDALSVLEPFGKGNPFPKFVMTAAPIGERRQIGEDGKHLRIRVGPDARRTVTAVGWGMGGVADRIGRQADLIFDLSRNEWNGRVDIQMMLEDIRC